MTKRELIDHLERMECPGDTPILIESVYDYGDSIEFEEWDMPYLASDASQHPRIVFGDVNRYNRSVQATIDRESVKWRPETELEAKLRIKREQIAKARESGKYSAPLVLYRPDITAQITAKVFASYLKP